MKTQRAVNIWNLEKITNNTGKLGKMHVNYSALYLKFDFIKKFTIAGNSIGPTTENLKQALQTINFYF